MRLRQRSLDAAALRNAIASLEIIEAYPNDKYLPSFLLRGEISGAGFRAQIATDSHRGRLPNSSPEDFDAVQLISQEIDGPAICGLSRAVPADIEACGKTLARAKHPRIHTGIGASDIHIMGKFKEGPVFLPNMERRRVGA